MSPLQDAQVLVLGLGESGLAMARWCARKGAAVRVWDSRPTPPNADALRESVPAAQLFSGAIEALPDGVQLVLKSPGLAPHDARIAGLLASARAAGVPVQGELDLFAAALAALKADAGYAPQLLAITGTNGKTTTTAMTALLVGSSGRRVAMAGNIGPTMLDTLSAALDAGLLPEVWVLELSSFQLDGVAGFEPDAAALLNLTQDHLDWHGSMAAYAAAKARIFGNTAAIVVNRDDALVEQCLPQPLAPDLSGNAKARAAAASAAARVAPRRVLRFGTDAPRRPGDFGLVTEGGMVWLARAAPAEDIGKRRGAEDEAILLQRLMPADALRVRGRHNAANALAALALATAIGCPLAPMLHALRDYRGEPHRVEPVGNVGGIEAYDDSKGTNVGATVAALLGLGADLAPGRLVLILGGDGKGQDFGPLAAPLLRHARAVATIGRDAAAIEDTLGAALAEAGVPVQRHPTLEAATAWCFAQAQPRDAVLLSPACASLDMFRNYKHRADVFVAAVQATAAALGEVAS